jgi:hypothetical protein
MFYKNQVNKSKVYKCQKKCPKPLKEADWHSSYYKHAIYS